MTDNILDIPRIFTGIAECMTCVAYASTFKPRLNKKLVFLFVLIALVIQCSFLELTGDVAIFYWIPCMMIAVGLMFCQLYFLCDTDIKTIAFICVRAFTLAEFAAALEWQIHTFLWPGNQFIYEKRYGLLAVVYISIFIISILLERRFNADNEHYSVSSQELFLAVIIGVCIFSISNLGFYFKRTPFSGQYIGEINSIRTLTDLCGITILYAYQFQRCEHKAKQEIAAMKSMLEKQYMQYSIRKESIDLINQRYHDLKHQIEVLRNESDTESRNRWLDKIEEGIETYEMQNNTGNKILDTLLTSKRITAFEHGIEFSVVADGKILDFMDTMDVCSLFGNAIDNAIECEKKLSDKQQRIIHLTLSNQKKFLLFQVKNYCPMTVNFRDRFPITTKSDPQNHGFGLKSIKKVTSNYGGDLTIEHKDDWFTLKVIIPLPGK